MIVTSASQCRLCKHYHNHQKCDAYPKKIPDRLWLGEVVHSSPFPGDHGIRLEWRDTDQTPPFRVQDD